MKKVIFYSYPKCSTCRKASKWLDQNNINYKFIDIVKEPPSKKFLEIALIQFSFDIKKIFNTRGKSFKLIDFDIFDLTKKKIIELLSNDGKLIKRPFLIINESELILGFNESEYAANFK
ncbi:putative arsenate reductase [Prochlorococcus marinus str. MIT 9515]|uniref:Putative arsenate reductase n=1 Tax=Prochlorococcus marinus (strain MIT 9515) TaxID=167542 RepID=A2BVH4_PROM5|nr:Spx/MgsR family RNA polymerase-binding regulatory protein [Prochlorococcus marinus]ABM71785.1 putative arsenate reductase [Prochlorococcus marinus str. MIT 9515]